MKNIYPANLPVLLPAHLAGKFNRKHGVLKAHHVISLHVPIEHFVVGPEGHNHKVYYASVLSFFVKIHTHTAFTKNV